MLNMVCCVDSKVSMEGFCFVMSQSPFLNYKDAVVKSPLYRTLKI